MDFKNFAKALAPAFPNARFVTAIPFNGSLEYGVYDIGIWTAEAEEAFKSKEGFDPDIGWGAMAGNITSFCLTKDEISFDSFGNASDINWAEVVVPLE